VPRAREERHRPAACDHRRLGVLGLKTWRADLELLAPYYGMGRVAVAGVLEQVEKIIPRDPARQSQS